MKILIAGVLISLMSWVSYRVGWLQASLRWKGAMQDKVRQHMRA